MIREHETALWFLNTRVKIDVAAADGEDGMSVIRHWAPFGDSPPLHVHDTEDEIFHVIEGKLRWIVGDRELTASAGQTIIAPKGVAHTYCVESKSGARFMTVTSNGDFEAMVREASRPATSAGLPEPGGPPSREQADALAALCARHKIRLVGEPLAPKLAA